ncbi:MAG: fused MFS/spermidine synthase [Burkholderiales bacterium]|nr:fused MFS/spermidine synthase [Burkholderiales bacterium]
MNASRFKDRRKRLAVVFLACLVWLAQPAFAGEKIILEKKSPYNTIYVSEDDAGLRILRFERYGARQSVVKLDDPDHLELAYARVIPIALAFVEQPESALVVGLGGGTIPGFLRKRSPDTRIDAVDIDPTVVEVAKSHFGFREDALLHAHVEDGRRYVEQTKQRYDLIFLDGFGSDSVPPHLTTREFLSGVKNILSARGIVVGNLWGRDINRLYDSMVKTYRAVYEGILIVDVVGSGNKLLIASKRPLHLSHREIVARVRAASQRLQLRHDLTEVAERNMRPPGVDGESGKLLTDAQVDEAVR